ncbi:hypothetical protein NDU88_006769 [Pleurodeles waltl]|uniref:Uncharacterized protein n=1 Tax=Pleurodeles waltl TaxID=8319 RepID=A0AAV7NW23_PLEWA|nr:hypothetical protein NDU88_006769 [Pleurodeles waltl]
MCFAAPAGAPAVLGRRHECGRVQGWGPSRKIPARAPPAEGSRLQWTLGNGCDLEAVELGLPPGSPDRKEKRQGGIQAPETRRVRGPGLGRTRVTIRKQRWTELRRAGRQ